jgi:hypothetical protein
MELKDRLINPAEVWPRDLLLVSCIVTDLALVVGFM